MAIEIQGINRVLKKLSNLENIKTEDVVEEVATDMQNKIRSAAQTFSDTSYMYISKCEPRTYGKSCFIDVGLKNDNAPFELWKNLYYHEYGYRQFYYGRDLGYMTTMHMLWFENAIEGSSKEIQEKLKTKLKQKIRETLNS